MLNHGALETFPIPAVRCPGWPSPLSPTPAFLLGVHGTLSASAELTISPFPCAYRGHGEQQEAKWQACAHEWHSALLHGDRTHRRYWGWDNKLQTRAGDGKLSHPETHGECCKANPGQGKIWSWSSLRGSKLLLLTPDCRVSPISTLAKPQELASTIADPEKHLDSVERCQELEKPPFLLLVYSGCQSPVTD